MTGATGQGWAFGNDAQDGVGSEQTATQGGEGPDTPVSDDEGSAFFADVNELFGELKFEAERGQQRLVVAQLTRATENFGFALGVVARLVDETFVSLEDGV